MAACHCTLGGSRACWSCSNRPAFYPQSDWYYSSPQKPGERIIERYENGKLVERIIEPINSGTEFKTTTSGNITSGKITL